MDYSRLFEDMQSSLGSTLPSILGALAILLIGWLVALVLRTAIRKGLGLVRLDERVSKSSGNEMKLESGIAKGAFYLVMIFVLLAFFNALELEAVSGSLQQLIDQVMAFAPKLIAGGVLLLVGWLLAVVARTAVTKALGATKLDSKLQGETSARPVSHSMGTVAYWLVLLFFLPAVLGALEMEGLLAPVQNMVDQVLAMLPRILAAAAIGLVGWFLARILREVVTNLLAATGVDRAGKRVGLSEKTKLSGMIGTIVYVLVLVPAIIAALNALEIQAISDPATQMLTAVMGAIPNIFAAAVILGVSYFLAVFLAGAVSGLLGGSGFDRIPAKLGLEKAFSGETTASRFMGKLIVFFVMLFAVTEAANRLGFEEVSAFVATMTRFGGQVLLGVAIIAVGLFLSNLAYRALEGSSSAASANLVRFAILGIVFAMGLRAMGIADEIVNLAFGLTLGAIAVSAALAFGLGGREAAGKQLERWLAGPAAGPAKGGSRAPKKTGKPSPLT